MAESRRTPPASARRDGDRGERPRSRPTALAAAAERHSGEGAASAWETWRQLERRKASARGELEPAAFPAPPARPPR